MSKHTKGLWIIDRPTFTEIIVGTETMNICTVLCIDIPEEEAEANAKLIAAAPDLLEACMHVLENLGQESEDVWEVEITHLQQAINKATL